MASITERENAIFDSMVEQVPAEFKGRLTRDGVPNPDVYSSRPVRVLFVFREANSDNEPRDWDQRAMVRNPRFQGTLSKPPSINGWWNSKVAGLGHAVAYALAGGSSPSSYANFQPWIAPDERTGNFRTHQFLFPFGFIQIKKVGGGGQSNSAEIERHANIYSPFLKAQLNLYEPHLIIGCGVGAGSPARLLNRYVLPRFKEENQTADRRFKRRFTWWRFSDSDQPVAMLEFNHPSFRGSREQQYAALASAVREITINVGLLS